MRSKIICCHWYFDNFTMTLSFCNSGHFLFCSRWIYMDPRIGCLTSGSVKHIKWPTRAKQPTPMATDASHHQQMGTGPHAILDHHDLRIYMDVIHGDICGCISFSKTRGLEHTKIQLHLSPWKNPIKQRIMIIQISCYNYGMRLIGSLEMDCYFVVTKYIKYSMTQHWPLLYRNFKELCHIYTLYFFLSSRTMFILQIWSRIDKLLKVLTAKHGMFLILWILENNLYVQEQLYYFP